MRFEGPPLRVVWSLLWRAVVLLPFTTLLLWLVMFAYVAAIGLPIAAACYIWVSEWWLAAGCVAAWFPAFLLARWTWRRVHSDSKRDEGVLI